MSVTQTSAPQAMALTPLAPVGGSSTPQISLWAASGSQVAFVPRNGEPAGSAPPETRLLPRLVLRRNGHLTAPGERTLLVEVSGLQVPPPGLIVTLQLETLHADPDRGSSFGGRIVVWRESRWIAAPAGKSPQAADVQFRHLFAGELAPEVGMPTDYLRLQVAVLDPVQSRSRLLYTLSQDHALLLENEWLVAMPDVLEEEDGAAPGKLLVYYCDMFPVRRAGPGTEPWLPRGGVSDYVGSRFVPAALEAFRLQADVWRFPWHQAWTPHGPSEGPKQLVVALAPPNTWYHGQSPGNGHAGISINVDTVGTGYESLLDGMMSTFHHELFHNLQRGLYQSYGLQHEGQWDMVTEGTAMLASSVAQPDVQFEPDSGPRAYLAATAAFLGKDGPGGGDLNRSYADISYNGAPFWRFLYEKCAMRDGAEDPPGGMALVVRALEALYASDSAAEQSPAEFVRTFPEVMDQALAGSSCPYERFEEGLVAFARAIYALRLDGGRCTEPGVPAGCGFHDPAGLYPTPEVEVIHTTGRQLALGQVGPSQRGQVPSSYGIDLWEIVLDPAIDGRPLTVELHNPTGAEFRLDVWKVAERGDRLVPAAAAPDPAVRGPGGALSYTLPAVDTADYNRLGLIIIREDNREAIDRRGAYTLLLR